MYVFKFTKSTSILKHSKRLVLDSILLETGRYTHIYIYTLNQRVVVCVVVQNFHSRLYQIRTIAELWKIKQTKITLDEEREKLENRQHQYMPYINKRWQLTKERIKYLLNVLTFFTTFEQNLEIFCLWSYVTNGRGSLVHYGRFHDVTCC